LFSQRLLWQVVKGHKYPPAPAHPLAIAEAGQQPTRLRAPVQTTKRLIAHNAVSAFLVHQIAFKVLLVVTLANKRRQKQYMVLNANLFRVPALRVATRANIIISALI